MLCGRRSIVDGVPLFLSIPTLPSPRNVSSRSSFLPTRDNSAPCCDSIARLFRINLAAGINQRCLQQRDTRTELRYTTYMCVYMHTYTRNALKDPSIPKEPSKTRQLHHLWRSALARSAQILLLRHLHLSSTTGETRCVSKVRFCLNYTVESLSSRFDLAFPQEFPRVNRRR